MAIPLCEVTGTFENPSGGPVVGAKVVATLSRPVVIDSVLIQQAPQALTDADGQMSFKLWPNVLATEPVTYTISVTLPACGGCASKPLYFHGVNVPNVSTITLAELLGWEPSGDFWGYWTGTDYWTGTNYWR